MTIEDLKTVQKISLEILFDIVEICERNNIEYTLMYGTLIGAVRHQGYIPWDDDIDLGMTRENYEKFLNIAPTQLSQQNELHVMGSGAKYMPEIKIGRRGTLYCLRGTGELNIMSQISVDIFLIDYFKVLSPRKTQIYNKIRRALKICKLNWDEKKLLFRCIDKSNHNGKVFYKIGLVCSHLPRVLLSEKGIEYIIYKLFVEKMENAKEVGVLTAGYLLKWSVDFGYTTLPFEGRNLSVIDCYHEILTRIYGDYMQLPPEDKRNCNKFDDWVLKIS